MPSWWRQPLGFWLAVATTAVLRLVDLDLMEFKGDEAVAIELALPLVEGRHAPGVGLVSSVGIHNPPLFIYLVALPATLSLDPRAVTGGLVGLSHIVAVALLFLWARPRFGTLTASLAGLLFACAPWPVLYGRKLWAQDLLPPLCVALLWAGTRFWERPASRAVALVPVLLCALFQLHYSAVGMIAMAGAMLVAGFRRVHAGALAGGTLLAALMLTPYLVHQAEHDYRDVRGLVSMARGRRANGEPRVHEKVWSAAPLRLSAHAATDHTLAYAAGPSYADFARERGAVGRALGDLATWVGLALALGGLLWIVLRARHGPASAAAELTLGWWIVGYLAAMVWLRLEEQFPHYFIILYPAPFLLMALALSRLWRCRLRPVKWVAAALLALVLVGDLTTLASFRGFLVRHGGTAGDYGVAYGHQAELARWLVGHRLRPETRRYAIHYLYEMTDAFGDNSAIAATVAPRGQPPAGARRARIEDRLRRPAVADKRCPGRQDFGPLVACPRP